MAFSQATIPELPEGINLAGQTAVVTGATAGIGEELSFQLLRRGLSHLIIGARSLQKGSATRLELLADVHVQKANPSARVTVLELDLTHFDSVLSFSKQVLELPGKRLDLLVLSAGINLAHFEKTGDGHEACMQVNVLSNSFLSLLLLPMIQKTSKEYYQNGNISGQRPTITWLGSMGHALHSTDLDALLKDEVRILDHYAAAASYSRIRRYPDTKLFVILFTRELARRITSAQSDIVIVNNVCPGTVATGADNNLPFWLRIPMNLNRAVRGRPVVQGARAVLWASRGNLHRPEAGDGWNGVYIANKKIQDPSPFVNTPVGRDLGRKLWGEVLAEGQKLDKSLGKEIKG